MSRALGRFTKYIYVYLRSTTEFSLKYGTVPPFEDPGIPIDQVLQRRECIVQDIDHSFVVDLECDKICVQRKNVDPTEGRIVSSIGYMHVLDIYTISRITMLDCIVLKSYKKKNPIM